MSVAPDSNAADQSQNAASKLMEAHWSTRSPGWGAMEAAWAATMSATPICATATPSGCPGRAGCIDDVHQVFGTERGEAAFVGQVVVGQLLRGLAHHGDVVHHKLRDRRIECGTGRADRTRRTGRLSCTMCASRLRGYCGSNGR